MNISSILLHWYALNKRYLPWRNTRNPYHIWVSEVILQQTRINQGLAYYNNFIIRFPDVHSLANADINEVLKAWEGLGYYSRARNMHKAAKQVVDNHNARFPTTYNELLKLSGIGDYTASAIASIAFGEAVAVLDGNVYRVLSRLFNNNQAINTSKSQKTYKALANELLNIEHPGQYNQAIMEFGALHCTPAKPQCITCPLQANCLAYKYKTVNKLPVKLKKQNIKNRYFNYLLILNKHNEIAVQQRNKNDIWKGLMEFVLLESDKKKALNIIMDEIAFTHNFQAQIIHISPWYKHVLTHRNIYGRFIVLKPQQVLQNEDWQWVALSQLSSLAFPRIITRYFETGILNKLIEPNN